MDAAAPGTVMDLPGETPARFSFWQAECLRACVLAAGVLTVGGAVALLVIGILASGGSKPELAVSWTLLALVVLHCVAQIWLGVLGFRAAMRWIAVRSPQDEVQSHQAGD